MLKKLLAVGVAILFVGCARDNVPRSLIRFDIPNVGRGTLSLPKDFEAHDLAISVDTNRMFHVSASMIRVQMNPQVISSSEQFSTAMTATVMSNSAILLEKGIEIGVKGAKAGVGIP